MTTVHLHYLPVLEVGKLTHLNQPLQKPNRQPTLSRGLSQREEALWRRRQSKLRIQPTMPIHPPGQKRQEKPGSELRWNLTQVTALLNRAHLPLLSFRVDLAR